MAVTTYGGTIADAEVALVAAGVAGQAGNDRNGKPGYPVPCIIQNLGAGVLYVAGVPDAETNGFRLDQYDSIALDLCHSIGTETSDADMIYAYAVGEATWLTLYTRQGEPESTFDATPPVPM